MLSDIDYEKLNAAQQSIDLSRKALEDLCSADEPLLAEHAIELLETLTKMNAKLQRILASTKKI